MKCCYVTGKSVKNENVYSCVGIDQYFYTEKEMAAAERAKERRKERTNERIKKAQHDWPRNNGFNDDNLTFIFTIGNTYEIKDELKEAGYKFNRELGWHGAEPFEKEIDADYVGRDPKRLVREHCPHAVSPRCTEAVEPQCHILVQTVKGAYD